MLFSSVPPFSTHSFIGLQPPASRRVLYVLVCENMGVCMKCVFASKFILSEALSCNGDSQHQIPMTTGPMDATRYLHGQYNHSRSDYQRTTIYLVALATLSIYVASGCPRATVSRPDHQRVAVYSMSLCERAFEVLLIHRATQNFNSLDSD